MFTGIVTEIGFVKNILHKGGKLYFVIETTDIHKDLLVGESVACNGICLTVCEIGENGRNKLRPYDMECGRNKLRPYESTITVEISHETAQITTATHWTHSTPIHLEKALAVNQRLNGHIVQGHVDATTTLINSNKKQATIYLTFSLPTNFAHLIVEHGSVCVDGVSLTAIEVREHSFTVALIDFTLKNTHFAKLRPGSFVNIEFDIIGKYVERLLNIRSTDTINGVPTEQWLIENAF